MMNRPTPANNGNHASTTEELIVQYLDGELVRKELETVLFDRLARSEEARMLLREYLVVRGAIRMTREDERFQLADDLDARTRARIEQIMEAMASETVKLPAIEMDAAPKLRGFLRDRGAIASTMSGRAHRWPTRASLVALSLLFVIGGTWFVTQNADHRQMASQSSTKLDADRASVTVPASAIHASMLPASLTSESLTKIRTVTPSRVSKHTELAPARLAQNAAPAGLPEASEQTSTTETSDPTDVMLSRRYAKEIDAAKHEVVVSSHDRL
jgi:hypothetical protein